jgi:uncharacterized protein
MRFNCTALVLALLLAGPMASAQETASAPTPGDTAFSIFLRGREVGREQVTLARTSAGWVITSSGQFGAPLDFTINRFELKYGLDWQPLEMLLEARSRNQAMGLKTSFTVTTAINEVTQAGNTVSKQDQISARTTVLPNNVFAAYEALAARLWSATPETELPIYIAPQMEIKAKVRSVSEQTLTGPSGSVPTRRFEMTFQNPSREVSAAIVVDDKRRLVRVEIPDAGLSVVRDDTASVAVRSQTTRNPTDADATIPSNGFNLAGTLTTPPGVAGRLRHPAVILVGGATPGDRDEVIGGVPVFAQLAKALSDSGHVVLRYDRKGAGQSGGRTESVTLADYADDVLAAVKWLLKRDDVDKRRVVVAGYGDGAPTVLLAASRSKDIDGIVTFEASGTRGDEMVLRQQERILNQMKLSAEDRQSRIALQKKLVAAVMSGTGWEGIPDAMRRQADTPLFKSQLNYDPAAVLAKVKQPILIIHGDRDTAMPSTEANKLADAARARKKAPAPQVTIVPEVSQTLAQRGEKTVDPSIPAAIAEWIKKIE